MSSTTIQNSSDFIFIYEAIKCNPNGDPDQENKPRMDYNTKTNLVTDTRIKRNIRDYLKATDNKIFVDMEGDSKVTPDKKLEIVIEQLLCSPEFVNNIFANNDEYFKIFTNLVNLKETTESILKVLQKDKKNYSMNTYILTEMVKQKYIDIRMFGSAFAVTGFPKTYTGPIQLNLGYSLNRVELVDSSKIVTTMGNGNCTFGNDYRVHYSLLSFNGTINKYAAKSTNLTENDVDLFRKSIWESLTALPTRSKLNQYPKLYLEVIYTDGYNNGYFGDLRGYVTAKPIEGIDETQIRKFSDLTLDCSKLIEIIKKAKEDKIIKDVIIKQSQDFQINI